MAREQKDASELRNGFCSHCQINTKQTCGGCLGAPTYDKIAPEPTFYCSSECQKADWSRHKTDCKLFQDRISLHRTATLLHEMMCRVRRNAYPFLVNSIHIKGTVINLEISKKDEQQHLYPFPVQLATKEDLLSGLLLHSASMEAKLYLHGLAKELFDGI